MIEVKGQLVGVETKLARQVDRRDIKHLAWMRDELGDRFKAGSSSTPAVTSYRLGDRLWALPVDIWPALGVSASWPQRHHCLSSLKASCGQTRTASLALDTKSSLTGPVMTG